ncbi:MAG: hypothetical protein F6K42_30275, partial [Leptolyngbya sp. SIO1D8]|nr:hypothetical protein [Leptolyngbya sp. SIO1D8]
VERCGLFRSVTGSCKVTYDQMSVTVQGIHRSGGCISKIVEGASLLGA